MAGEFMDAPQPGAGTSVSGPDLRDPLGPPHIISPEEQIALYKASGYVPGTMSLLPTMTALTQAGTSLIDNAYAQQMAYKKSQADLDQSMARTKQIGADTDLLNQDYQNKALLNPILNQQQQNKLDLDKISLQQTQRQQQEQTDAIATIPEATSALPDPDDPDYANKRDQWRIKYNRLLTNPATRARMEGEYSAVDSVYQSKISTQQTNDKRKEFYDLQTQGYIPSPLNPDKAVSGPDADNLLTKGRMLQSRHQAEMLASQFPADSPVRPQLQAILDEADKDTGSDSGVQDVQAGKSKVFDTNGRLTGVSQAAIAQAQNSLTVQQQEAIKAAKPETQVEVPFGKPNQKGEYPGKMTIKGVAPSVGELWAQKYGLGQQPSGAPADTTSLIQDPGVRDLAGKYQRHEISRDQFIDGLKQLPAPSANSGGAAPGATPTSNNNYVLPKGTSSSTSGINSNVFANVMAEEGPEFGKDGKHDSVFGLWADSKDVEGEAYRIVQKYGPNSPEAYNAVTDAWTQKFLQSSKPWELNAPGLQELVIADSQHVGGEKARAIIDKMGGYDAVNAMPPAQAIAEYSELRKPLWPGNNKTFPDGASDRVTREMQWALAHNDELAAKS
jgi:hypothetical protein